MFSSVSHDGCVELHQGGADLKDEQARGEEISGPSETEPTWFQADSSKQSGLATGEEKGATNMKPNVFRGFSVLIAAGLFLNLSLGQNSKEGKASRTTPTVLFVCEHGAAKSVIAAAYFKKQAKDQGLNYTATFRGVNPDPILNPVAEEGLKQDGMDMSGWKPVRVAKKDVDDASQIVTLGCALPAGTSKAAKVTDWSNIPSPSQNYPVARDEIKKRVQKLVNDLAREERAAEKGKR